MLRLKLVQTVLAFGWLLAMGVLSASGLGQDDAQPAGIGPLAGVVVDAQNRPAAGAEVWLYRFYWEKDYHGPTLAKTTTDSQGRFHFPKTTWNGQDEPANPSLLARDAQGRLAPGPDLTNLPLRAPTLTDLRLVLLDAGVFRGRLVDVSGQPIAKASVRPIAIDMPSEAERDNYEFFIPNELLREFKTTTAADGSFSLRGVPARGIITLKISAAGFSTPIARGSVQRATTIELARVGRLRGTMLGMKAAGATGKVSLQLRSESARQDTDEEAPGADGKPVRALFFTKLETQPDGSFERDDVPAGKYTLELDSPGGSRQDEPLGFYLEKPPQVEVKPAQTASVALQLRAAEVAGLVVDEAGKPVAGAHVYYTGPSQFRSRDPAGTDAEGRFTIRKVLPDAEYLLRAQTARAVANQVAVTLRDMKPPLRLVVSEKKAFPLRGQVVDEEGRPVEGQGVSLTMFWRMGMYFSELSMGTCPTDAQGRFEFRGLWAGDDYQAHFSREGYDNYESSYIHGTAGRTHDLGTIPLRSARNSVAGTVTDSAGKPLAGVRVFNSGDGPQPVETQTDVAGRFRLQGLFRGPVWVFAEKGAYRFTGLRTHSGTHDASVRMLRADHPPPPRPPSRVHAVREEQRKVCREMVEKLWNEGKAEQRGRCIGYMARLNLEQAQRWSAETGGKHDPLVRQAVARRLAAEDPDEALALTAVGGDRRVWNLLETAQRLARSHPASALRFVEEAVVAARAANQPERTSCLAKCGLLLNQLGNKQAGRKIIEEAADMALRQRAYPGRRNLLASVAVAVGSFDTARALQMVQSIKEPQERPSSQAKIAAWCLDDLGKAESILKDVEPWYANRGRVLLACRLAAERPQDAVRCEEKITSDGYDFSARGYALGWIARAVAPRDKALACSLIDKAMAEFQRPKTKEHGCLYHGGEPAQAALLVVHAREVGYPDLERLAWQVLALRPTTRQDDSPARLLETQMIMALLLAWADPELARPLLEDLQPRAEPLSTGHINSPNESWIYAWALVDPRRAVDIARRADAAFRKANPGEDGRDYVIELMWLYSRWPEEQFERITLNLINFNSPEEQRW